MLDRFGDWDRSYGLLDELRRRMDRLWDDFDGAPSAAPWRASALSSVAWPRLNVFDAGAQIVVTADVPGLAEADLDITVNNGTLAISGERKSDTPKDHLVHRQERSALRFMRTVSLPAKVNAEQTSARVKDGVLTITLAKAPEAQPRHIAVRAH